MKKRLNSTIFWKSRRNSRRGNSIQSKREAIRPSYLQAFANHTTFRDPLSHFLRSLVSISSFWIPESKNPLPQSLNFGLWPTSLNSNQISMAHETHKLSVRTLMNNSSRTRSRNRLGDTLEHLISGFDVEVRRIGLNLKFPLPNVEKALSVGIVKQMSLA